MSDFRPVPVVQFGVNSNWTQVYSETKQVQFVPDGGYQQFPPFELGVLLETPVIAVHAELEGARPTWRFAGHLYQRFAIGSGGAGSPLPYVDAATVAVPLNRPKLVAFTQWRPEYSLVLVPPFWLETLTFRVFAYTGPISDQTHDLIVAINQRLSQGASFPDTQPGGSTGLLPGGGLI